MKVCGACKIEKETTAFWRRTDGVKERFHWQCIECEKKKRQTPEYREKQRVYSRRKKRKKCGLDPDYEGFYKSGPKANPETKSINNRGYCHIWRPNHPNARSGKSRPKGRILEHVFIMSEHLGRPIKKHERIHHKNGIRSDNRIENLELWHIGQPPGQRVEDKLKWCKEFIAEYDKEENGQK